MIIGHLNKRCIVAAAVAVFVVTWTSAPAEEIGPTEKSDSSPISDPDSQTTKKQDQWVKDAISKAQQESVNGTDIGNTTTSTSSTSVAPTTTAAEKGPADLPPEGSAAQEHHSSLTIFFILLVVAICILVTHLLIQTKFYYLPESIAVVLIGALIGLILKIFEFGNWREEEAFPPTVFFIVLLPPIIFESGYNLHKGNFFQNIGSILVFAILGTVISAMVVGGGIYLLGQAGVAYKLSVVESFAFGSLISAVDPVATLAIFHSIDVDTVLYMLVFGESILNDAVAITLTITVLEFEDPAMSATGAAAFFKAVWRFCIMFFGSSLIGMLNGLLSAMILKFIDLRKTPSLEFGMILVFSYLPYGLAEGLHLSGIMAILMSGIVMSHYTHSNLSPVTQITVQQTFRTIAFIAETCMFAYLGLAIFSFKLVVKPALVIWSIYKLKETCVFAYLGLAFFSFKFIFKPAFVIWSIALILIGRSVNIFPLSFILNYFREHKITRKQQFIMWFSGLRGAIAFALSLHLELKDDKDEKKFVLVTTTLIIVLFTIMVLGGATMPIMKLLKAEKKKKKKSKRPDFEVTLSKTKEMGETVDSEHMSELTEEEREISFAKPALKGFMRFDERYLKPFFTRQYTQQEVRDGKIQMDSLTTKWKNDVRAAPDPPEQTPSESEDEEETLFLSSRGENNSAHQPLMRNS